MPASFVKISNQLGLNRMQEVICVPKSYSESAADRSSANQDPCCRTPSMVHMASRSNLDWEGAVDALLREYRVVWMMFWQGIFGNRKSYCAEPL